MDRPSDQGHATAAGDKPAVSNAGTLSQIAQAELLVREADQRISSSLDYITDILHTKSRHSEPKVQAELEDVRHRIIAIGKLHKLLSLSDNVGSVALDGYLHAIGDELGTALADSSRTLLINVDDLILPARLARVIGLVVHDFIVGALKNVLRAGVGVVQVACGTNRDGNLTLEITDDGVSGKEPQRLDTTLVSNLVSHLGAQMVVESSHQGLRCTIEVPANILV